MKATNFKATVLWDSPAIAACIILLSLLTINVFCNDISRSDKDFRSRPENLADGWEVSTLEQQGIRTDLISELLGLIDDNDYRDIHGLVIVKNGYLVLDQYFYGYDNDDLHSCFSVTKSVSSALVGIALEAGLIESIGVCLMNYCGNYQGIDWSGGKDEITVKNMLTMRSGLEWEELATAYSNPNNSHYRMTHTGNWIRFVLERPMEHVPGSYFEYNTGTSNVFALILQEACMMPPDIFAEQYLLRPLDIADFFWNRDSLGFPCTGGSEGGIMLRPRDMAKFGFMYLNDGVWNDQQVVPPGWIRESTSEHVSFGDGRGYGYQWWLTVFDVAGRSIAAHYALGYGGQYIFVIENLNLVVVFTGGGYGRDYAYTQVFEIMTEYILPAAEPDF
jgi:CubicO group peptidase (beta-lactamase class C family)